jgi:hypothetical protein
VPRDRPPGIWESLKRALGGAAPEPEPRPEPPSPPEVAHAPKVVSKVDADSSAPPFLLPDPEPSEPQDPPAVSVPTQPPPTSPPVEPPGSPGLARGLASFSKSNADREKKFAHLLRDDAPADKKKPPA